MESQKLELLAFIDSDLKIVREYSTRESSKALAWIDYKLEECRKLVSEGDWEGFEIAATEIKSYLSGMVNLAELCCGSGVENDETRATLKVPVRKGK